MKVLDRRIIGQTYFYLLVAFSIVVLGYSLWMLSRGILSMKEDTESFYYSTFIGAMGIMLAASSLIQIRRRITAAAKANLKTLTVVLCDKCGFKMIRNFAVGDFVYREVGKCQQCESTAYISQIYQEPSKP